MVSSQDKPDNHPIYVVDTYLGSSIFFNDSHADPEIPIVVEVKENKEFLKRQDTLENKQNEEGLLTMYFEGSINK